MKPHLKYLSYVLRHKWFVLKECCKLGIPWRGIVHDLTKFYPREWSPYVEHFYTDRSQHEGNDAIAEFGIAELAPFGFYVKDRFNLAWLFHQHKNPHHWQYWILREDDGKTFPLPIPNRYVREMVADWRGAGRAITGKNDPNECALWYVKNHTNIVLHPHTRMKVEKLLGVRTLKPEADEKGSTND